MRGTDIYPITLKTVVLSGKNVLELYFKLVYFVANVFYRNFYFF